MTNFLKRSPLSPKIVSATTFPIYDTLFAYLMATGYSGTTTRTTTADTGIPAYQGMVKISGKAPTRPIKGANKGRAFHYHPARRLRRRPGRSLRLRMVTGKSESAWESILELELKSQSGSRSECEWESFKRNRSQGDPQKWLLLFSFHFSFHFVFFFPSCYREFTFNVSPSPSVRTFEDYAACKSFRLYLCLLFAFSGLFATCLDSIFRNASLNIYYHPDNISLCVCVCGRKLISHLIWICSNRTQS